MRVKVDATVVTPVIVAAAQPGLVVIDDWLTDLRSSATTDGLGEGFFYDESTAAAQPLARFDNWTSETLSVPPLIGDLDMASVVMDCTI